MIKTIFSKVLFKFSVLLFSLILASGISFGAQSIIGFGDSITQGLWTIMDPGNGRRVGGYEPTLESHFSSVGIPTVVYNYGYGGEFTTEGLLRINTVLNNQAADFALIMEGTNDVWDGISVQTTIFNLGQMIDKCRLYNVEPIIATLTPDTRPQAQIKKIPTTYNPEIRLLASQKGVPLADHYDLLVDDWDTYTDPEDRLHPNDVGYAAMAKVWFYSLSTKTLPATKVISTSATLNGTVGVLGEGTQLQFEYGPSLDFGTIVSASPNFTTNTATVHGSVSINKLSPKTTYYYRLVTTTNGTKYYGKTNTFSTRVPALPWLNILIKND